MLNLFFQRYALLVHCTYTAHWLRTPFSQRSHTKRWQMDLSAKRVVLKWTLCACLYLNPNHIPMDSRALALESITSLHSGHRRKEDIRVIESSEECCALIWSCARSSMWCNQTDEWFIRIWRKRLHLCTNLFSQTSHTNGWVVSLAPCANVTCRRSPCLEVKRFPQLPQANPSKLSVSRRSSLVGEWWSLMWRKRLDLWAHRFSHTSHTKARCAESSHACAVRMWYWRLWFVVNPVAHASQMNGRRSDSSVECAVLIWIKRFCLEVNRFSQSSHANAFSWSGICRLSRVWRIRGWAVA